MTFGGLFARIIWRLLISKYIKSCLLVLQTSIPISHLFKHPFLDLFWALWNREYPLTVPAPHTNVTALVPAPGCLGWVGEAAVAQYYFHGRKITTINYKDASQSLKRNDVLNCWIKSVFFSCFIQIIVQLCRVEAVFFDFHSKQQRRMPTGGNCSLNVEQCWWRMWQHLRLLVLEKVPSEGS